MADWAVAMTPPLYESKASTHLSAARVATYFPRFLTIEAKLGRIVHCEKPLFPCYLFIEQLGMWREAVLRLIDRSFLLGLLMSGGEPARLSGDVIDELRQRAAPDGLIHLERKKPRRFKNGALVRVRQGVMTGLNGIVAGMSGEDRVRILLDLLGRQTPVTLKENELAAA